MITIREYQDQDWPAVAAPGCAGNWSRGLDDCTRGKHSGARQLYEQEGFGETSRFVGDNAGYPCSCIRLERATA